MVKQGRGGQGQSKNRRKAKTRALIQGTSYQSLPIISCMISKDIFKNGIGHVVLGRKLPNGKICAGIFLMDVYCLGVKNAVMVNLSQADYKYMLATTNMNDPLAEASPCCAHKLIQQSIDYSAKIGISPHKDYKKAGAILMDIDSSSCDAAYEFGCNGKPYYISGPDDSPARIKQIHNLLRMNCGEGNYEFINAMEGLEPSGLAFIDDPFEVEDLIEQMNAALPMQATIHPEIFRQMQSQYDWLRNADSSIEITGISYIGDGGGIACELNFNTDTKGEVMHVSLTHLVFTDKRLPCYKAIFQYQQRRVKNLKKQGQFGGRFLDVMSA